MKSKILSSNFKRVLGLVLVLLIVSIGILINYLNKSQPVFFLKPGDLLFQDLHCGQLCSAIVSATTEKTERMPISHVAMVISTDPLADPARTQIIEAYNDGVKLITLKQFLARSTNQHHQPRVLVGRLQAQYQVLIPAAIIAAKQYLGQPYNHDFYPDSVGLYCSELIYQSFKQANHGQAFFELTPMNFKNLQTQRYPKAWITYFAQLNKLIPQGKLGTNPADIARDPRIKIIYNYVSKNNN